MWYINELEYDSNNNVDIEFSAPQTRFWNNLN
jgi:hypothetical protein